MKPEDACSSLCNWEQGWNDRIRRREVAAAQLPAVMAVWLCGIGTLLGCAVVLQLGWNETTGEQQRLSRGDEELSRGTMQFEL
jgi:hypothetical protein